jgi:hypothetical protein
MLHASLCDMLALCYYRNSDPASALVLLQEALPYLEAIYGENSVEVGNEMFKISQLLFNNQQRVKAKKMIKKSKKILTACYGKEHADVKELDMMLHYLQ